MELLLAHTLHPATTTPDTTLTNLLVKAGQRTPAHGGGTVGGQRGGGSRGSGLGAGWRARRPWPRGSRARRGWRGLEGWCVLTGQGAASWPGHSGAGGGHVVSVCSPHNTRTWCSRATQGTASTLTPTSPRILIFMDATSFSVLNLASSITID